MKNKPKVSVCMITYNHAAFIEQAVHSVVEQQTDFSFELVIGEDCSSDNTLAILKRLQLEFPQIIHLLPSEVNLGVHQNFMRTLNACRGKYIAFLEGDDYWVVPQKLQRQVEFLELHPECSMCGHSTRIIDERDKQAEKIYLTPGQRQFFDFDDILDSYIMHTSSVMFRKNLLDKFSDWFFNVHGYDWVLFAVLATYGRIGYIDEVMSVNRRHSGGIWSPTDFRHRFPLTVSLYNELYDYLTPEYQVKVFRKMSQFFQICADTFLSNEYPKGLSIEVLENGADEFLESLLCKVNFNQPRKAQLRNKFESGFFSFLSFKYFEKRDYKAARSNIIRAASYDRSWLKNRGFWSILGTTILGENSMRNVRYWINR